MPPDPLAEARPPCRAREYVRAEPADVPGLEAAGWRVVAGSTFADHRLSLLLVRELTDRVGDTDRHPVDAVQVADVVPDAARRAPDGRALLSHGRSTAAESCQPLAPQRRMDRGLQGLVPMTPGPLVALLDDAANLSGLLWLASDAAARRGDEDTHRALRVAARVAEGIVEQLERLDLARQGENACGR